jgi:hypothetical protein
LFVFVYHFKKNLKRLRFKVTYKLVHGTTGGMDSLQIVTCNNSLYLDYCIHIFVYNVVYCRVSSAKQSDDLQRQVEHMRAQFPGHRVITDVGSGINFKRKGLPTLLGEAQRGRVRQVVVAHRDRLCRFAFDLVEWILTQGGATLLVQHGKQDLQHEFSEDLMAIVHVARNGVANNCCNHQVPLSITCTTTSSK